MRKRVVEVEKEEEAFVKTEKEALEEKIREIKEDHLSRLRPFRRTLIFILIFLPVLLGIALLLASLGIDIDAVEGEFRSASIIVSSLVFTVWLGVFISTLDFSANIRTCEEQLKQLEDEHDLVELVEGDHVKRSEKLFRNHQRELKRYYDINLGHYRWMFPAGIMTIIFGTLIIAGTIWVFRDSGITPILIGAISGVLVDFVGAVLIHMYTQTVKSSIAFHSQLMKSNHALFANMLAFKIEDTTKKDETFAELAKLMIQSNVEPKE